MDRQTDNTPAPTPASSARVKTTADLSDKSDPRNEFSLSKNGSNMPERRGRTTPHT
ncbi:hypothetical protein [Streptacidiphilus carbonis]|uniref:hypothetical protein n=1 Tax=Streptacidiphilus carbonis TaxID=105422 RepID=UPI000A655D05|nr:hypothetical protein [Streptacidiphilus carbonis]